MAEGEVNELIKCPCHDKIVGAFIRDPARPEGIVRIVRRHKKQPCETVYRLPEKEEKVETLPVPVPC